MARGFNDPPLSQKTCVLHSEPRKTLWVKERLKSVSQVRGLELRQ